MSLGCALADADVYGAGSGYLVAEVEASVLFAELLIAVLDSSDDSVDLLAFVRE